MRYFKIQFMSVFIALNFLSSLVHAKDETKQEAYAINWSNEITDTKMCKLALAKFDWYCDWAWPKDRFNSEHFSGFKYYWFDFNQDNQLDLYIWEHGITSKVCGNGRCHSWVILQEKPSSNAEHFKVIDFPPIIRDEHPHLYWPDIGKLGSISIPDTMAYDVESNREDHKFDIDVFLKEESIKNVTVRDGIMSIDE